MSDNSGDGRSVEMEAVRTTIVGGRPPGSGKHNGAIPRGIEVLVKKAAVDPAFCELLIEKRAEVAGEIGLELDPAEAMMLKAVPEEQLRSIIAKTNVDPKIRPAFLARSAAMMLVALGAVALSGCESRVTDGVRPDKPPENEPERPERIPAPQGIRPDRRIEVTTGERVDLPAPNHETTTDPDAEEPKKPERPVISTEGGARPDRIESPKGGMRADNPAGGEAEGEK